MNTSNLAATPQAIRDELTGMVVRDLLGPAGGPEEELDQREDRATGRYLVGMLAPKSTPVVAEEQDRLSTDGSDDAEVGATEAAASSPTAFFPNSTEMGFVVHGPIRIQGDPHQDRVGPVSPGEERHAGQQTDRRAHDRLETRAVDRRPAPRASSDRAVRIRLRPETELVAATEAVWAWREPVLPYRAEATGEKSAKGQKRPLNSHNALLSNHFLWRHQTGQG